MERWWCACISRAKVDRYRLARIEDQGRLTYAPPAERNTKRSLFPNFPQNGQMKSRSEVRFSPVLELAPGRRAYKFAEPALNSISNETVPGLRNCLAARLREELVNSPPGNLAPWEPQDRSGGFIKIDIPPCVVRDEDYVESRHRGRLQNIA